MTRNVYLGADLSPAIEAEGLCEAVDGAGVIYNEVQRTNFPERAVPLAREIRRAKPHLVGLQEVALWRTQTPTDLGAPPLNPNASPAKTVAYDFLDLLMDELGARYRVVGVQEEFDAELPADTDANDATGNSSACGADLDARLTMRDVILARDGVKTGRVRKGHYEERYVANVSGVEIPADRGWLWTPARVGDANFRFVNTHLEAFGDPKIREAQAKELIRKALRGKGQRVLVGDLNSGLRKPHRIGAGLTDSPDDPLAFKALKDFGMKDRGAVQSCCFPSALNDPSYEFDHTVDHVLVKPGVRRAGRAFVTGDDPDQMTPSGLWPSDHGGVVSKLLLP
jgi:endonuclease/exonuclease/phosphatase family metal-dependent hydrolase